MTNTEYHFMADKAKEFNEKFGQSYTVEEFAAMCKRAAKVLK